MTINDIITALKALGLGGTDILTGETVISGATLDTSINGDGGLTITWKSETGGLIRGGTMFLGYVMKENYVPTLGSDGLYSWSPKFSEPAVLLEKNNYGKRLTLHTDNSIYFKPTGTIGEVVAVVKTDSNLDDNGGYSDGDLAIVTNPATQGGYASCATLRTFTEGSGWSDDGRSVQNMEVLKLASENTYWRYVSGVWLNIGAGNGNMESTIWTSVFAGEVSTIVTDLNTFFSQNMPDGFTVELKADTAAELTRLRNKSIIVTFDGSSYKKLINDIAEQAEANAYYVGKKVIIGRTDAYADTDFFNRFIVLGGNKNMAKRTVSGAGYAPITQRLHLDETEYPGSVIDMRADKTKEAPFETFLVFDDIYPKLNLTIRTAKYCLCYCLDEDGNKISDGNNGYKLYAKWYVTFNLDGSAYSIDKDYIIQDKPLSLLFQSGPLTGRQFELTMLTAGSTERNTDFALQDSSENSLPASHTVTAGECCIILEADGELLLPGLPASYAGGGLCPQADNWVTLVNVAIEDRFRVAAQNELLEKGMERAELIYNSKTPTLQEERTFTDVITGETSGDVPDLGESYKGYVVTGISENLITGAKTVSYGTFKPKGLLKSAIDKIESYGLSGGESTKGKEVSTKTESGTTIIYIHDENEGGNNSTPGNSKGGSLGSTSQAQSTAIRQAGGNTNIKTLYEKIESVSGETGEDNIFAALVDLLWKHRNTLGNSKWSSATLKFSNEVATGNIYLYDGTSLYYNSTDISSSQTELKDAFAAVYGIVGDINISVSVDTFPASTKYNLCLERLTTTVGSDTIEGGIRAWMYDGDAWVMILSSTTALIENLGNMIRLVVFGATDGSIETAGMLTTQNFVSLFSKATSGNKTLAEAAFGVGVKYHVSEVYNYETIWIDVVYDSTDGRWEYNEAKGGHSAGEQYLGQESAIVAYGFAGLSADLIDFNGKDIVLESSYATTFKYGNDIALQVTGAGLVNMANTTMASATVNTALTACDKRTWIHYNDRTNQKQTEIVVRSARTDSLPANHVIELGMKEYTVGNDKAANSYLNLFSFESDWATSLGYINMKCGDGDGTDSDNSGNANCSKIIMGVGSGQNTNQDNIVIRGDYLTNGIAAFMHACNTIAVRGRFAIIPDNWSGDETSASHYLYGANGQVIVYDITNGSNSPIPTKLTIKGGIITAIEVPSNS